MVRTRLLLLLSVVALLTPTASNAQTTIFSDDFEGVSPPTPGAVLPDQSKWDTSIAIPATCCDAVGVELLESRLEWGDGFEEAVVLVADIAAEEHQVHLLFDRAFNEPCPHRCAGESFGIPEVIGDLAGASADVKVAGGEDLYGHQFQGSVRGDVNLVSRRRAGAGGAILA